MLGLLEKLQIYEEFSNLHQGLKRNKYNLLVSNSCPLGEGIFGL